MVALSWEDFERLCLRLAETEGSPEHWQIFGTVGQDQGGIDILVRTAGGGYVVWQSKRHSKMTPARLKQAVDRFLQGVWASKAERFILATSADLTATELALAIETQAARLRAKNIIMDVRDVVKLSNSLKAQPRIVDDFFDRPWTEKFCGAAAVKSLDEHLARGDYDRLRNSLATVYEAHFASVDPGVLRAASATLGPPKTVPLRARYIPHDLLAHTDPTPEPRNGHESRDDAKKEDVERRNRSTSADGAHLRERQRVALEHWAAASRASIVLGPPGAGKSTLLRYLALELLSPTPQLQHMRSEWGGLLPVWVSFPYWTRLIESSPPGSDISLEAAAAAWLSAQGRPELVKLIRRALRTGRCVLLVDGIDEWSGETAADTALGLLNAYVAAQSLPAVVTSRPHGGRLLGSLDSRWGRFELAGLTQRQQVDFASAWLEAPSTEPVAGGAENSARTRAERIVADINRSAEIASLATTPLMLGGLLALSLEGASLPRNRFAAYRELTARLLESHPRARDKAALAQTRSGDIDISMRRRILGALAFNIQQGERAETSLDSIPTEAAVAFCKDRFVEYLGLPSAEASAGARRLIAVGEESLGILVEKSPSTVGFLHRAFQEFLSASYLNSQDIAVQCDLFRQHGGDPQWREVLLFAAQAATKESEVDALVSALEAGASGDPALDLARELLLCDITFSDVCRSLALTRRLAERFFSAIEVGSFETQRIELLQGVIAGLGSEQTAILVRPRLSRWFPKWTNWNHTDAIQVIAKWSEPDVDDVLWRCLQLDRLEEALVAAKSLAERRAGDETWRKRFTHLARNASGANVVAAAVAGLAAGWPDHSETALIVGQAAQSQSRIVATAGIEGRSFLGHSEISDRDRIVGWMLSDEVSYDRQLPRILSQGWPDWEGLKGTLLSDRLRWSSDPALTAAIETFPGDDGVARHLVSLLERQKGLHGLHSHWREVRKNFEGHPVLVAALEEQLDQVDDQYALANAAYVTRSAPFRAKLLGSLQERSYLSFWTVDALLDLWPRDPEVKEVLARLVEWDDDELSEVAHRLPEIMTDMAECRARLIRMLSTRRGGRHGRADRILIGLAATGPIADDPVILAAALKLDPESEYFWAGMNTAVIIENFKDAPAVQALAKRSLHSPTGLTGVIALCQGHIPEMRAEVLSVSAALPDFLRMAAIDALRDRAVEDDFALDLLSQAQNESEEDICAAAQIAVAEVRMARRDIPDDYVEFLSRQLQAIGDRMAGRRLGAVAALGILGRAELVQKARETDAHWNVRHLYRWRDYGPVFAALAKAWPSLATAFGDTPVSEALGIDDEAFLAGVAPGLVVGQEMRNAVDAAIDRNLLSPHPRPSILALRARERKGSQELKTLCLGLLERGGRSWNETESVFMASRILAEDFHDDPVVFQTIIELSRDRFGFGAIAALSDGWHETDEFRQVFDQLVKLGPELGPELSMTPVIMKVTMAGSKRDRVVSSLREAAGALTGQIWDGLPYWLPNAVRRLQREPELENDLMEVLKDGPSANEILTITSLLAAAYGVTPELRRWIDAKIISLGADSIAMTGMDLWRSRPDTPVRHRLVEIINSGL